jgi:AraC family transcriptional regulator
MGAMSEVSNEKKSSAAMAEGRRLRALNFIETNLHRPISLADIAGAAAMSPCHFSRSFSSTMGMAPMRYLLGRRVHRSKVLMSCSKESLSNIADACGFATQSHFTTSFRKLVGVTPLAWRTAQPIERARIECTERCILFQRN